MKRAITVTLVLGFLLGAVFLCTVSSFVRASRGKAGGAALAPMKTNLQARAVEFGRPHEWVPPPALTPFMEGRGTAFEDGLEPAERHNAYRMRQYQQKVERAILSSPPIILPLFHQAGFEELPETRR